ncbi:S1/P1 nuclease [Paludisphaera mucosa]|uniref:S1/P1 nuclease n=1 Tax=Paludisphaera mucosa TaxID=3030827 RepID=A0ABT6FAT6_9BACT|nr:S1/P1 nuclease [Paludisphaera mucosa]MDG3004679.1 S1/P1 nuclease [Paludisphaera mucosa]
MPSQAAPTRPSAGRAKPPRTLARRLAAATAALLVAVAAAAPKPAFAWGRNAHRAAARLAESRLTPEARALVRELLDEGESLADASTWADENSRDIPGSASWHFVNVPITAERYSPQYCRDGCVVSRLAEFRRILADPTAPKPRRRMALRYVVHLVEDVHQPMHVGDRRDRGGNTVQLSYFRDEFTNLHQVWDSGILRVGFRNERELADALFDVARRPEARNWLGGDAEDWADESLKAAKKAYLMPGTNEFIRPGARLGREYQDAQLPVAVERLARAGMRLSDVLNADLAPPKKKAPAPNAVPAPHFNRDRRPSRGAAPAQPSPR